METNSSLGNPVIEIVAGVPPQDPETAEKFYKWYNEEHSSHVFDERQVVRKMINCRRLHEEGFIQPIVKDYPELITINEYRNKREYKELLASMKSQPAPPPAPGGWGTEIGYKKIWYVYYEVVKTWER